MHQKGSPTEATILCHRLDVVAALAQWLPIVAVPEQRLIALMRNNVINHRGWF